MATSYANTGGTGNRTSIITVTQYPETTIIGGALSYLVNGNTNENVIYWDSLAAVNRWVKFDFNAGNAYVIDEVKYYQQNTVTHGVYKFQGSNDDSAWDDLGSTFTMGSGANGPSTPQVITTMSANTTAYRYYRFLGVSGTNSGSPWIYEFEFKIGITAAVAFTAPSTKVVQAVNRGSTY
jgi:hypothetical protein